MKIKRIELVIEVNGNEVEISIPLGQLVDILQTEKVTLELDSKTIQEIKQNFSQRYWEQYTNLNKGYAEKYGVKPLTEIAESLSTPDRTYYSADDYISNMRKEILKHLGQHKPKAVDEIRRKYIEQQLSGLLDLPIKSLLSPDKNVDINSNFDYNFSPKKSREELMKRDLMGKFELLVEIARKDKLTRQSLQQALLYIVSPQTFAKKISSYLGEDFVVESDDIIENLVMTINKKAGRK